MPSQIWTEQELIAPRTLALGSIYRTTLNLCNVIGAYLLPRIARGGTTGLTNGIDLFVSRQYGQWSGITPIVNHPGMLISENSGKTAAAGTTVGADSASGQHELKMTSVSGFAVGDTIAIVDSGLLRVEFNRISKLTVASGTGVTLNQPLQYTHTSAQGDAVRNQSYCGNPSGLWLDGGAVYGVSFDYGNNSAGESAVIQCFAQVWVS